MQIKFQTKNELLINSVNSFIDEWNSPVEYIRIKTSGSTGEPKEIVLRKEHMQASAKMTSHFLDLNKGDTALLCLSPDTVAGKMMIVRSLVVGMNLIITDVSSQPLTSIESSIDFCAMVPLQAMSSLKELSKIKTLIIGGGSISPDLSSALSDIHKNSYHTFGMTETISHVAMRKIENKPTFFKALPGISFDISEDSLIINAPMIGVNALHTNDIVHLVSPTEFDWRGRKDFVINSGGIKLHPETIEEQISSLIKSPFFCSGLFDDKLGQKHILCVLGNTRISKQSLDEILNKYEVPKEIYYFDQFEYTKSGKINRLATLKTIANAEKQVL